MCVFKKSVFIFLFSLSWASNAQDPHPNPVANYQVSNLCYMSISSFSNTSIHLQNPAYQWTIWQMGNSAPIYTSSATNINFQFPAKTTYTVLLSVINYVTPTHTHSDQIQRTIQIDSIPIADFDLKSCTDQFSNLSCCANSFIWDFGDGTPTSTLTSPAHTYSVYNNYTVSLISSNGLQSDTATKVIAPYPNTLTGNFNIVYDADTVRFNAVLPTLDDSLKGVFCQWNWAFGDGTTKSIYGGAGWNVNHSYQKTERDSIYIVFLLVRDACFTAYKQKNVLIKGIGKNVTSTSVFPSPVVYGYLNLESVEKENLLEIRIVDCLGRRLDNLTVWDKPYGYYLWIGNIASGVYTVQLVFKDRIENHKVIKE